MHTDNVVLSGSLDRVLLRLSVPLLAGYLFKVGLNWVDTYFVGLLGRDALAGVMASLFAVWASFSLVELVSVGTLALVARSVGARDREAAGNAATTGLVAAFGLGLVVCALSGWIVPWAVGCMGVDPATGREAERYLRTLFLGFPIMSLLFTLEAVFRAAGDTRTPMLVLAGTFVLNMALDYVLIFGLGPIPELGVVGAALASVASRGVGLLVLGALLLRRRERLGLTWSGLSGVSLAKASKIVRIGVAPCLAGLSFCMIYLILLRITAGFGSACVAALGVGLRFESLTFLIVLACGKAAATVAGQNLGAGQPERARLGTRRALLHASAVMLPCTFLMFFGAEWCADIFVEDDPEVVAAAALYLRTVSWMMVPMAFEIVLDNVAGGVGDTRPAMAIEIVGTALRVGVAYALVELGSGFEAVCWAVAITMLLKAVAFELWFRRGAWVGALAAD